MEVLKQANKTLKDELEKTKADLKLYCEREDKHLEKIKKLSTELEASQKLSQQHKKRLDQSMSGYDAQIRELTEKFMSEAQRSEMTNQAQFQNLQSEHTEILRELREQHQTEKEVWKIEQKAILDEIRRDASFEKEEALRELTREWNDKNEDLHASMSKDAMEIQKHWETKLEEAKSKSLLKSSRLQGEMEVIKDRLGREIQRRKQNQAALADALEKYHVLEGQTKKTLEKYTDLKYRYTIAEKKSSQVMIFNKQFIIYLQVLTFAFYIQQLKIQNRTSERLARDLLAITSPSSTIDSTVNLPDILQAAVRQVSIMRIGETNLGHQV